MPGEISLFGKKASSIKSRESVGFLPEHPYFYDYLTPIELLTFTGRLFGMSGSSLQRKAWELIELAGLKGKEGIKLRKFSKGMIQRIGLGAILLFLLHLYPYFLECQNNVLYVI